MLEGIPLTRFGSKWDIAMACMYLSSRVHCSAAINMSAACHALRTSFISKKGDKTTVGCDKNSQAWFKPWGVKGGAGVGGGGGGGGEGVKGGRGCRKDAYKSQHIVCVCVYPEHARRVECPLCVRHFVQAARKCKCMSIHHWLVL